ncbi:hypothetical protein PYW08_014565 [Mythimna loreyi]|uniref:Uncharacterized protein n=1 Tax=Mythimna loreyi TaxID=667449 RepID=A0ACC2R4Z3_9NEOP|nr:hypothetical protein PYW08_014565 [Mythimna loreyi]
MNKIVFFCFGTKAFSFYMSGPYNSDIILIYLQLKLYTLSNRLNKSVFIIFLMLYFIFYYILKKNKFIKIYKNHLYCNKNKIEDIVIFNQLIFWSNVLYIYVSYIFLFVILFVMITMKVLIWQRFIN